MTINRDGSFSPDTARRVLRKVHEVGKMFPLSAVELAALDPRIEAAIAFALSRERIEIANEIEHVACN